MNPADQDNLKLSKSNFISSKTIPISKEYTMGKTLGSGAFGTVRLAIHKATKQTRAVKVLKKSEQDMELLLREVEILTKLSHPNIMQIYEVFQDKTSFYIVSEYCKGGELFDILSKKGSLSVVLSTKRRLCLMSVLRSHLRHLIVMAVGRFPLMR